MFDFKQAFPRLVTIFLFAGSAFVLLQSFPWTLPLTTSLILFLNLIIIFSALSFGGQGVLLFGSSSILIVLLHGWSISKVFIAPVFLLSGTTVIFYIYCWKMNNIAQGIRVAQEDIEEEKNILSVELEHIRMENNSLKQKLHRYSTLKGLTETLSATLSLDKTISLITSEIFRIIGKSNVSLVYLVDKDKQELNLVSSELSHPRHEVKEKKGDIFDNWVFKQRARLMVLDTKKDYRFNIQGAQTDIRGVRSLIAAPFISQNKLLGIIRLDNVSSEAYDADDLRLLDIISDLAAVAIENTLLYQEMEKLAITDGLTGLLVHRHFQERFEQEVNRAIWTNSQFGFAMIDIDDFKSYNDKYGHIAGDIVLRQIAQLINSSVNPGDIVARYGGEEFAVLLVDTPKKEAISVVERVRKTIEEEKFILRREVSQVHISAGVAFFPDEGRTRQELIFRADQAMYKAKHEGKNRICIL